MSFEPSWSPRALSTVVALALGCTSGATRPEPARSADDAPKASSVPAPSLPEPTWLPPEAREMLMARMHRHGEEMMLLVVSVVILSYDGARHMAEEIVKEPKLGRPAPGEQGTINALLPPRFFSYQDELEQRASAVAEAAEAKDPTKLVVAYGKLAETCVGCHAVYMSSEPAEGSYDSYEQDPEEEGSGEPNADPTL